MKYVGRHIFRKLNLRIGIALLCVFLLIGFITNSRFYSILGGQEQELLNVRVQGVSDQFSSVIDQFKRETTTLYPGDTQSVGVYERFLPNRIPSSPKDILEENQYFSGLMSFLLTRIPLASNVLFYRISDNKLFYKSRTTADRLNPDFNARAFFSALPESYQFLWIGGLNGLTRTADQPLVYFVNPIFDFQNIRPDRAYGYFVICLDHDMLMGLQDYGYEPLTRLIIYQRNEVLFDSAPAQPVPQPDNTSFWQRSLDFGSNDLQFVGMKDKSVLQAKLSSITVSIVETLMAAWIVCILLIYGIQRIVHGRLKLLSRQFKKVQANPFTKPIELKGNDEFTELVERFDRMTLQVQQHINQTYVADIKRRNAEYYALKVQINPHFLYNTLESLRMQALVAGQRPLSEKLYNLGRLYRWLLKSGVDTVTIREEIQYNEYYLDLFMTGKSNPIELRVETDSDITRLNMLKFSLQPIVENALVHGDLAGAAEPLIHILIAACEKDNALTVEVRNNGQGLSYEEQTQLNDILSSRDPLQQHHIGLKNVHDRIRAFFGNPYGLVVLRIDPREGFGVCMKLPIHHESWDEHGEIVNRG